MTAAACPVCASETEQGLEGLLICRSCGLAFTIENITSSPIYRPELECGIYDHAKRTLFSEALACLGRPGRILDIGCAAGELMKAAAARGWRPEGVEIDTMLAAKAAGAGFTVYSESVEKAGLATGAYDAVTAFEVFSQMAAPAAAAAEIHKLLKEAGTIYIREFNASFHLPLRRLELAGIFDPLGIRPSITHNFNFNARSLRVLLRRAGFRDIRVRNSRPTSGDPYRTGGLMGGFLTGLLKFLYYMLAETLWYLSFGRVFAGSSLIVTAHK